MAYYALHKFHWKPSEILELDRYEKAFIWASISIKADAEKEAEKKAKSKRPKRR